MTTMTTMTTMTNSADSVAPDPQGAAERIAERGAASAAPPRRRGRPPGTKSTERERELARNRKRRQLARERGVRDDDEDDSTGTGEPYAPDENRIIGMAQLGRTVWAIAGKIAGYRELNDEEAMQLGTAMDPVAFKYLPFLGKYADEINLAVVVFTLAQATKVKREPIIVPETGAGNDDAVGAVLSQ